MFELTESLDLKAILTDCLRRATGEESATGVPSPRLLSQERDGCVLYTWNGPALYTRRGAMVVTHVGLFDPDTQANKILWSNDTTIQISTCSVNQDRTLMAYTTYDVQKDLQKGVYRAYLAEIFPQKRVFSLNIERPHYLRVQFLYGGSSSTPEKVAHMLLFLHKESIGLYHIPLARVERGIIMSDQPVTEQLVKRFVWCQWESLHQRLFYMVGRRVSRLEATSANTTRPVLSCLQFSANSKYEYMLDLPLNMSFPNIKPNTRSAYLELPFAQGIPDIALNICVLSLSNGTLCVCYQHPVNPTKEKETDEVDIEYTITLPHHARELQGSVSCIPWSVAKTARLSFTWINEYLLVFLPGHFVHALNVSIEFEPCHHILLHRKNWEACLEEDMEGEVTAGGYSEQTQVKRVVKSQDETDVKTPVLMGDTVSDQTTVKQPLQISETVSDQTSVKQPASLSEETAVKRPVLSEETTLKQPLDGENDETDVKQVYKGSDETAEKTPVMPAGSGSSHRYVMPDLPQKLNVLDSESELLGNLSDFIRKQPNSSSTCGLFDCAEGKVYQLGVNTDTLVFLFSMCYMASTRQAILHYVIRQGRELGLLKQLFEMVAYDCASLEVPVLMEEFLVGLTYMNLRRQVERDVFQLLPFTTSETFRGLFEKIASGQRLSRVSYVSLMSMNIGTKSIRERQQRRLAEDLWDNLCLHLRSRQLDQPNRFSQDRVQAEYRDLIRSVEKGLSPSSPAQTQKESFLGRISARARLSLSLPATTLRGRADTVLGMLPPFLSEGALHPDQDKLINLTERLFAAHLGKYLRKDSKIKVANVAKEYISCQMQQAKQLCHILWSIRGPVNHTDYIPLSVRASEQEYELFQLLERFYMAVQELAYPVPPGFHTYFTVMGFRALSLSLFLQYVDRGVLLLTEEFVAQIMEDLPNDDASSQIKLQVISRLPKPLAEECFQQWDHPIAYRHTAIQQVSAVLRDIDQREGQTGHPALRQSYTMSPPEDSDRDEEGLASAFHPLDTLLDLMHKDMENDHARSVRPLDRHFIRDVATFHTSHNLSTINF